MWMAWGNCLLFVLFALQTENLTSLFMEIPLVSFYTVADSVTQQIRNCPYKTLKATTGTRPPLVADQYSPKSPNSKYRRTLMARTLTARLPRLFGIRSGVPWKKSHSCRFGIIKGEFLFILKTVHCVYLLESLL